MALTRRNVKRRLKKCVMMLVAFTVVTMKRTGPLIPLKAVCQLIGSVTRGKIVWMAVMKKIAIRVRLETREIKALVKHAQLVQLGRELPARVHHQAIQYVVLVIQATRIAM